MRMMTDVSEVHTASFTLMMERFQRCVLPPSWWWKQYASLKRRPTPTRLHDTISQKALIFICRRENLKSHIVNFVVVFHVDGVRLYLWTASTSRPIVHPRVIYGCRELRWNYMNGETEELGENLSYCHSVRHKSHTDWHGREPVKYFTLCTFHIFVDLQFSGAFIVMFMKCQ
jgi:hypothetical protein